MIEFGEFATAYEPLRKAASGADPELKSAAITLHGAVMKQMEADINTLNGGDNSSPWQTYREMRILMERYNGYRLPEDFTAKGSELHQHPDVQREFAAHNALQPLKKGLTSTSALVRQRFAKQLDGLIERFPGTDAAAEAEELKAAATGD